MRGGDVVEYLDVEKEGIAFARYGLVVHSAMLPDARPGEAPRPGTPVAEHLTLLVLEPQPDPAMHGLFHLGKQIYGRVLAAVPPVGCGRGIGWRPIFPEAIYRHPAPVDTRVEPEPEHLDNPGEESGAQKDTETLAQVSSEPSPQTLEQN